MPTLGRTAPFAYRIHQQLSGGSCTGSLPDSLSALVASDAPGWLGPYAKEAELKDPWNHAFEYRVPGDDQPFSLVSFGKDGQAGGTSVDADIAFQ